MRKRHETLRQAPRPPRRLLVVLAHALLRHRPTPSLKHDMSTQRSSLRNRILAIAQFVNRRTPWLNFIKNRLGLFRFAEASLLRKLTGDEIESIRSSFCTDYVARKIKSLRSEGIEQIHFYIFLVQSIGDIVANEPIPRYLKSLAPTGIVHWIVNQEFQSILESNPIIDEVIPVRGFAEGEDLCKALSETQANIIVDCHFNGIVFNADRKPHDNPHNPGVNVYTHYFFGPLLTSFSLAAGLPPLNESPAFHLRPGIQRPDFGTPDYVVFHCRSNESARDWNASKWNQLAQALAMKGFTVVEIGTERVIDAKPNNRIIDYTGNKDLQELAAIIRDATLFIGVDSAFGHIANCFKTQSIILLGKYKTFDTYLPYSGSFPLSEDFTAIRAPTGLPASKIDYSEVLTSAIAKLSHAITS